MLFDRVKRAPFDVEVGKLGTAMLGPEQDGVYGEPRLWAWGLRYHSENCYVLGFGKMGIRLGCRILFPCDGKLSGEENEDLAN